MARWKRLDDGRPSTAPPSSEAWRADPRVIRVVALKQQALELQARGRLDLALDVQQESVDLGRELTADHPEPVHAEQLADNLYGLAAVLIAVGREESALPVLDECEAIYRRLADDGVDAVPLVADVRARRANVLFLLGRTATATVEMAFVAETYLNLAYADGGQRHAIELARVLSMNAAIVAADGDPAAACASADLAIRLYWANTAAVNASEQPITYVVSLIDACRVASAVHAVQGRLELALAADDIAVGNAESLVRIAGVDHTPRLVEAASRRAAHLFADGRPDRAAVSLRLARDHDPAAEPATVGEQPRLRRTLAMALMRAGGLGIDVPAEVRALAPGRFSSAGGESAPWAASRRCGIEVMLIRAAALGVVGRRLLPLAPPDGILVCLEAHTMYAFAVEASPGVGPAELRRYSPGWHALLAELIVAVRRDGRAALADDLRGWAAVAEEMVSRDDSVPVMLDPGWGSSGRVDPRRRAGIALVQMRLGERSARIGRLEDALIAGEESVRTFRSLVADTDAYLGSLAEALHLQAAHLFAAGRTDEAAAAESEAAGLRGAGESPDEARDPDGGGADDGDARLAVADTLIDLARRFSAVGHTGDARATALEALDLLAELTDHHPDRVAEASEFTRDSTPAERAVELNRMGITAARSPDKIRAGRAAVMSFRNLAEQAPDEHLTGLAMALNNLGGHLAAAGDYTGAIAAAEESVSILRGLDGPALASAVANLGRHLQAAGNGREALAPLQEAAHLFERLTAENADPYVHDLDAVRRLARLSGTAGVR